ncbi:MAG: TRIC cation channel family protein [Methanomicrobiaceae archaeon]|nr:TRIC cation channel family protein [Methanomicrobiaceae archaeon]
MDILPFDTWYYIMGVIGIAVFSITGVLAGAKKGMDLFGIVIIGVITALGGGTVRDLILDIPVFWTMNNLFIAIALAAAIVAFFLAKPLWSSYKTLLVFDGLGVAIFNVQAIDKTLAYGFTPTVAIIMGIITGITGGMIRDLLTGNPNLILKQELYATPILLGGIFYILWITYLPDIILGNLFAILLVFFIRFAAIKWDLRYPHWLLFTGKDDS